MTHATPTARHVKIARSVPLIAAIIAPLITLLDIPALSQRWFLSPDGKPEPDPATSIGLSIVSLVFCAVGNGLLVARFSVNTRRLEAWVVQMPLVAFWIKTIAEIVNLAVFGRKGAKHREGATYGEGFWAAVFSCGLSGVVAALLLFHYTVQRHETWKDSLRIRVDGRHFILSVSIFVFVIAIMALIFSKIEGWYFLDGVYFSIVSTLTVGFGDFEPTKTSTKILLFPFAVLSIALLANQVSMIVDYFGHQSELRKTKWRAQRMVLAKEGREKSLQGSDQWGLEEEMKYLERLQKKEKKISQMYNMIFSVISFLLFWTLGAVVFWAVDDLPYGESLYFCFVFFLTIGYGDNSPTSPVSKVFFIFYSLIAVPVIASFAVQTVAAVLSSIAERRVELNRAAREARMLANKAKRLGEGHHDKSHSGHHPHRHGEKGSPPMSKHHRQAHDDKKHRGKESAVEDAEHTDGSDDEEGEFIAHARFVLEHWDTLEEEMSRETKRVDADADDDEADDRRHTEDDDDTSRDDGDRVRRLQDGLAKETLELACKLESQARALLIMALPRGGKAQTLLRADRNVQRRDVKALGISDKELLNLWDWEQQDIRPGASEAAQLRSIRSYRQTFSRLLVVGARLRQLDGKDRDRFLRTRTLSTGVGEGEGESEEVGSADPDLGSKGMIKRDGEAKGRREMEAMDAVDGEVEVELSDGEGGVEMKGAAAVAAGEANGQVGKKMRRRKGEKEKERKGTGPVMGEEKEEAEREPAGEQKRLGEHGGENEVLGSEGELGVGPGGI